MRVFDMKPLSLAEARDMAGDFGERKNLEDYFKKFTKLKADKAKALEEEIRGLKSLKIKEEHVVKISDFLPRDAETVNKIFSDVSLDEKETNDIISIVSRY